MVIQSFRLHLVRGALLSYLYSCCEHLVLTVGLTVSYKIVQMTGYALFSSL